MLKSSDRHRKSSGLWRVLLCLAALYWPAVALADFKDCSDINPSHGDQIVVGDIGISNSTNAGAAAIAGFRLHEKLRAALTDLTTSFGTAIYEVRCPGHSPQPADYSQGIVRRRFDAGVVIELWGITSDTDAELSYALLPLLPPVAQTGEPPGFYDLPYTMKPQGSIADLFDDPAVLRAFTELSSGLRALEEARRTGDGQRYGRAYTALCKADSLLVAAADRAGTSVADWPSLRKLATSSADAARKEAAARHLGSAGALANPPAGVTVGACAVPPPDAPVAGGGP